MRVAYRGTRTLAASASNAKTMTERMKAARSVWLISPRGRQQLANAVYRRPDFGADGQEPVNSSVRSRTMDHSRIPARYESDAPAWFRSLRQPRSRHCLLEQRLHRRGDVSVRGYREEQPRGCTVLQVRTDLALVGRNIAIIPAIASRARRRQRQIFGIQHRNQDAAILHRRTPGRVEWLLAAVSVEPFASMSMKPRRQRHRTQ